MYTFDLILRKWNEQNLLTSYDDDRLPFPVVFTQIKFTKLVSYLYFWWWFLVCTYVRIEGIGLGWEGTRNTIYICIGESDDLLHEVNCTFWFRLLPVVSSISFVRLESRSLCDVFLAAHPVGHNAKLILCLRSLRFRSKKLEWFELWRKKN